MKIYAIPTALLLLFGLTVTAQTYFGPQLTVSDTVDRSYDVHAADLTGNGMPDIIGCSFHDNYVLWWQNLGTTGGVTTFGPTQLISDNALECTSVSAADVDGDGLNDVISGSAMDDKIAWYKNMGSGIFGPQQVIATDADATRRIFIADMNGDGTPDVLSANRINNEIAYYPNTGSGTWGSKVTISTAALQIQFVHAADFDGDGDMDACSASPADNKIAWYENLGAGIFGAQQIISTSVSNALSVFAADFDNDGDADVISAGFADNTVGYHENLGGSWAARVMLSDSAIAPRGVYGEDLDGDGDKDVISASQLPLDESEVAWYENLGGGLFAPASLITDAAIGSRFAFAEDMDSDGDFDVLVASLDDFKVSWYENLGDTAAVCDPTTPPSGLTSAASGGFMVLNWNEVSKSVACQIAGSRTVPPGPSPKVNITGFEVSQTQVPFSLLGSGTTWEWRVRCACSIPPDPLVATGFSATNSFSVPVPE